MIKKTVEEKREYLRTHGWYEGWSNEDWLPEGNDYSRPDWAGLSTEDAYKKATK